VPAPAVLQGRAPLLSVRGLARRWPGVQALAGIDLDADAGEVLAVVGANGAGKSTLMNILAGAVQPSAGEIRLNGRAVRLAAPAAARAAGIATVYQEFSLVPQLSVARNVWLGREPAGRCGLIDSHAMRRATAALSVRYGLALDPDAEVGSLAVAAQQRVELARALTGDPRILILDEPTAVLALDEQERLFTIVRGLRARGLLILYVSHHLAEVLRLADRVAVLRDGRLVSVARAAGTTLPMLVAAMVGAVAAAPPPAAPAAGGAEWHLRWHRLHDGAETADLRLRGGTIVGLAGLVGAGRSTMARALIGAGGPVLRATLTCDGRPVANATPRAALRSGVVYLTEDRKRDGLFAVRPVAENALAARLALRRLTGIGRQRVERQAAAAMLDRLRLVAAGLDVPAGSLSGGNQQKVLIGRALLTAPRLLVCDEPTRGVDIAAKAEIHGILRGLAAQGVAVVVISSEFDELLAATDRIVTVRGGAIVDDRPAEAATAEAMLAAASGVAAAARSEGATA
jgi:ABC-type sugar transport system ATPase subunit